MKTGEAHKFRAPAPRLTLWVPTLAAGALSLVFLAGLLVIQR